MEKVTLLFENEALKEIFLAWFSDGGGESDFLDPLFDDGVNVIVDYSKCFPAHGYLKDKHGSQKIAIKYENDD